MILLLFVVLALVVLSNKSSIMGIYLTMTFLLPGYVRIYPIPISLQLAFIAFMLAYTIYHRNSYETSRYTSYVIGFCVFWIGAKVVFAFLGTYMPFNQQLDFNATFMSIIIMLCWLNTDGMSYSYMKPMLFNVLLVVMIYGILTSVLSVNPYFEFISRYMGDGDKLLSVANRYSNEVRGGLTGRISVVTYNPLQYAILLVIFFYLVLYMYLERKEKKYLFLLSLMFINIFLAGSRGPIVALISPILLYLFIKSNFKQKMTMIGLAFLAFVIIICVPFFDSYLSYIKSFVFFFDESYSDAADIKGSSVSGRFEQLEGSLEMIVSSLDMKTILFGFGQGYTNYYLKTFGYSTEVLGFESAIFVNLVNHGFIGLFVFFFGKYLFLSYVLYSCYKKNLFDSNSLFVLISLVMSNFIYSILVGPVYEDLFFVIFFVIIKISIIKRKKMFSFLQLMRLYLNNQNNKSCYDTSS